MGLGMLGGYRLLRAGGMGVLAAATRIGGATAGGMGGSMLGGWGAQQLGYQPGSWGHDLASLGGGLLGGWAGYKGGERIVPGTKPSVSNPTGGRGPNGFGDTVGKYSKRPFDPESAGGPIESLSWEDATITKDGIETVKRHTGHFEEDPANTAMIERLEQIERGELKPTDWDKRYYTHEQREYQRYKNLGIDDGVDPGYEVWNDTHTATLEDFQLGDLDANGNRTLYHPDAIK